MGYSKIKNRARVKRITHKKIDWVRAIKGIKGCYMCGEKDPLVLDLHHQNGDKSHKLRTRRHRSYYELNWDDLKKEVEKCSILCANCHRRITVKERGWKVEKRPVEV